MNDVANTAGTESAPAAVVAKKSIVPAKYTDRYKGGGSDALAHFINEVCKGKDGFDYAIFFNLCRKNGIPEEKVAHYETQVITEKRMGSQGRARMTLRNMLATIARKNGKLLALDGNEHAVALPKPAVTGAAAQAQADAAAKAAEPATEGTH